MILPNLRQKDGSYLCGAYSVVACVRYFGLENRKVNISLFDVDNGFFSNKSIEVNTSLESNELAQYIYKITGIGLPMSDGEYVNSDGFNPMFMVVHVLRSFGFDVVLTCSPGAEAFLGSQYPDEYQRLKSSNIRFESDNAEQFTNAGSLKISVIFYELPNGTLTSHYVTNDDKGSWLDTELDEHPIYWDKINDWNNSTNKRQGARWAGVSLIVSLPNL
ncbi:hypothetical protein [Vibrio campbellii]|uniref:hypothetical protein n=1 Tax=Vibrio campbellii TaxID=680 RepID=UPI0005EEEEC6|nr:hypothetical protein [Vibrio campbellii]